MPNETKPFFSPISFHQPVEVLCQDRFGKEEDPNPQQSERLDAVIEAVFIKHWAGFSIGHHSAQLLKELFLKTRWDTTSSLEAMKGHSNGGSLLISQKHDSSSFLTLPFLLQTCRKFDLAIANEILEATAIMEESVNTSDDLIPYFLNYGKNHAFCPSPRKGNDIAWQVITVYQGLFQASEKGTSSSQVNP
nr:origin of replication complex subunit 3 isoform X2 [Ipomoea batatas]